MVSVGTQWSGPFQANCPAKHSVSPSLLKFVERVDYFFCHSVLISSYTSICQCTSSDTSAAHGHCFFLKKHHFFPKAAATIGSHLVLMFLLCLFCGVYICNPSVTGTPVSNLELINCCFQFLRIKQQQVTICTSLLPLHNLIALDLHQSWPFYQ